MKYRDLNVALLAAGHILACVWLLWYLMPRPEGHEIVIEGIPVWKLFGGTRASDSAVVVNGLTLGCGVAAVAANYSCPKQFDDGVVSRITYFKMTTLEAALGLADPTPVLLAIEQGGEVKYWSSGEKLRKHFFIGGSLIPLCLFGISFLWLKRKLKTLRLVP